MIDNKWFCEPDPFREKYCFFYLSTTPKAEKQVIKGWKSGIGNIDGIALHKQSSDENERHLINSLIPEIKAWRRKNMVVVADTEEKLPLLRTMIALLSIDEINLSTIKTVSLEGILKKYFSYCGDADLQAWCKFLKIDAQKRKEPELMRMVLQKLVRLIPGEEMP